LKFLDIDLDGLVCRALLNEAKAPHTTEAVWKALPFGGRAVHAQISGDMFRLLDPVPVGDLELEGTELFQHPGSVVYYPPIREIAFCVWEAQFSGPHGSYQLTPLAEIEGDLGEWGRRGNDLIVSGARPIEFRRAQDQETPFRYPSDSGKRIELTIGEVTVQAALLEGGSPLAVASVVSRLPLEGRAVNSDWGGSMTRLLVEGRESGSGTSGALEQGTTFHWPGYVYLNEATGGISLCYGDASERFDGTPARLIPIARVQGDLSAYQDQARNQYINGAKEFTCRAL